MTHSSSHQRTTADSADDTTNASSSVLRFLGTWKGALVVLFALALCALGLFASKTASFAGDYAYGPVPTDFIELRMRGIPRASLGPAARWAAENGPTFYAWTGGREFALYGTLGVHLRWKVAGGSGRSSGYGVSLRSLPTQPSLFEVVPPAGTPARTTLYFERFPAGSLQKLHRATGLGDTAGMVIETGRLMESSTDSLAAKWWHLDALILDGQRDLAHERFTEWESEFEDDPIGRGPVYAAMFRYDYEYSHPKYDVDHRRFTELELGWNDWFHPAAAPIDLKTTLQYVREAARRGIVRRPSLMERSLVRGKQLIRIARVESVFAAVRGDHDAAHELLLGALAVGTANRPASSLWEGEFDADHRGQALLGFAPYYLDGRHSAERLERFWEDLRAPIAASSEPIDFESWLQPLGDPGYMSHGTHAYRIPPKLAAQLAHLFAAGFRARHYRLVTGDWPTLIWPEFDDRGLLLSWPVETRELYRYDTANPAPYWKLDGDDLVIWSVGPDRDDDAAAVAYDPTNGTFSSGDLIVRLTPEPRYDWPSEPGYLYEDYDDFDRRYPGGKLPPDPFSHGNRDPIRLARDHSHRVWSFGPGRGQDRHAFPFPDWHFAPMYDPTNGTWSSGNLWMELPLRPDAQLPPAVIPAPAPAPDSDDDWFSDDGGWATP